MINELIKLATHLDNKGYHEEADYLDVVVKQAAPLAGLTRDVGLHNKVDRFLQLCDDIHDRLWADPGQA